VAQPPKSLVLLGVDHADYGVFTTLASPDGRAALALSVGGEHVRIRKGDLPVPNEDAVAILQSPTHTLLAIADGHLGHWASHGLIETLAELPVPADLLTFWRSLRLRIQPLPDSADLPAGLHTARSTLLVALINHTSHRLAGFSYGDSSLLGLPLRQPAARLSTKNEHYVSPWLPDTFAPQRASQFEAQLHPGDLVLACSDGVDECHYERPDTSVRPDHLEALFRQHPDRIADLAAATLAMALRGVDGHPGGQDNAALAIVRV
jgi:hypothetical protein